MMVFRLFGNGFHAWTTYQPYCAQTTSTHTDDCFTNVPEQKLETTTRKSIPTFAPFTRPTKISTTRTTTRTTTTPKTTSIAPVATKRTTSTPITALTLTPFKQFKFTTFKPFSFTTLKPKLAPSPLTTTTTTTTTTKATKPTKTTTKLPAATVQLVNIRHTTSTTRQPAFSKAQQQIPTKLAFAPTYKPFEFTTPRASALISTTKSKKYSFGIYKSSYFTTKTTTERTATAFTTQSTTSRPTKPSSNVFTVATNAPKVSTTAKFNVFDLYLGRLSTKPPQRYVIPAFPPLPSQPIGHLSPYKRRSTQATLQPYIYSRPNILISKAAAVETFTEPPPVQQVQRLFQSKVTSIGQSLGIQNSTYASLDSFITSPKGRVYRYSFSGTTTRAPALQ